ncbi:unnamed protein product [Paramecium pentaurelia]|uniref:Uncharacterized protein n=1 Tax=Paramecium pentaurelia TaxID=43138 RepID=A0A8S1TST4_9CILI|nr:unnamed protein product [Paramecium pentaurelia]
MNQVSSSVSLKAPLLNEGEVDATRLVKKSRRNRAGVISQLFFAWVYGTIEIASKVTLENDMIEDLRFEDTSEQLYYRFMKQFEKRKNEKNGLIWSLISVSMGQCIFVFIVMLFNVGTSLINPLLIKWTIQYLMKEDKETQEGLILIFSIIGVRIISVICQQHSFYQIRTVGYDWMGILSMALLGKSMNVSYQSNKEHTSGQVLNYMQVDAMKLQWFGWYMSQIMLMPLQIAISIYMMFKFIGVAFLGGLGVILLTAIFNIFVGKKMMEYQIMMMKDKDKRTNCANEIFQQIKFIKVNAYEEYFRSKLTKLRNQEIKTLKTRFFASCLNILSVWLSPMLILNATFVIYVAIGNNLTPANTFAIISLFQSLQGPLLFLPMALNALIEANISFKRVQGFLLTKELMNDCITNSSQSQLDLQYQKGLTVNDSRTQINSQVMRTEIDDDVAIKIDQGTFYWSQYKEQPQQPAKAHTAKGQKVEPLPQIESDPILKNINLRIEKGQFVAIVGDVGSGKSSLIQAMLGEMIYKEDKPRIQINGSFAYVSQKAWIQNATVKENILFGLPFDQTKYDEAIKFSCLKEDIKILVKGDQTMIGEKGVNLSGGQKARVSLARAIYSNCDIYLLDDPISAVDVHVGKFIIYECLNGYLKDKTRILVTHALNYCQYTDYVYLMDNGTIAEQGTFADIKQSEQFKKVYQKFYKDVKNDEESQEQINEVEQLPVSELKLEKKQSSQKETPTVPQNKDEIDELMLLEDRNKGSISFEILATYIRLTGGVLFASFMVFMMLLWDGCYVGSSLWMAHWTQQASEDLANGVDTNNYFYLTIYSVLSLSYGILAFLRSWALVIVSCNQANNMHNKMVSCLMYAPQCQFFERVPLGRIMNRLTKDQNVLDSELQWTFNWMLVQVFLLLANTFLNIYTSSPWVAIPMVIYFFLCWKIQRIYMAASRELFRLEAISKSPILSYFSESIMGITTIRAFQRQSQIMNKHGNNQDLNRKIFLEQIAANAWFGLVLGLSSFMVNTTAIVFCMFYSTKNPAYAGLLMTYASTLDQNINGTVQCLGHVENGLISFERCVAYTKVKPEKGYEAAVKRYQNNQTYRDQYIPQWPKNGIIEYKNYSVQYREGLPLALKNMSIVINPREKIGIVSRTGAGKSTITLTILRILEGLNGQLLIDGHDISTISLRQLRESITMIMQDPTLFSGTIRDNIDPLNLRTDEEVLQAINKCCLTELIESRKGLESNINDHGDNLSAGEKQLVCIARAVLKKSPIVLIDEATANIDIDTEHKIQDTIQNAFSDCTVITIAHRINTILHCDKILVLDKGEVKEFGYTKDLLNQTNSLFYGIYQEALKEQSH